MAWDPNQETRNPKQDPDAEYEAPTNPYGNPQNPYSRPPYTSPAYEEGYGSTPPPRKTAPLPLGEAIRQLPGQYFKILTRPSEKMFVQEMSKAGWGIVWVQLLSWAVIVSILGVLANVVASPESSAGTADSSQILSLISIATSYGQIVLIPLLFFMWVGLLFLFARAFGGEGTFLAQSYTTLLFQVPLSILSSLLSFIPLFGLLAAIIAFIYNLVLQVPALIAVHHLSRGRATASVLGLLGALLVILCPLSIALALYYALSQLH